MTPHSWAEDYETGMWFCFKCHGLAMFGSKSFRPKGCDGKPGPHEKAWFNDSRNFIDCDLAQVARVILD